MLKVLQSSVSKACDQAVEEVMGWPGNLDELRLVAREMYVDLIGPIHDWPEGDHGWIVTRVAVVARLKSDFGIVLAPRATRLEEFVRIHFVGILTLPEETIVLLGYLLETEMVSSSVFLNYGLAQVKVTGKEEYARRYLFEPVGVPGY